MGAFANGPANCLHVGRQCARQLDSTWCTAGPPPPIWMQVPGLRSKGPRERAGSTHREPADGPSAVCFVRRPVPSCSNAAGLGRPPPRWRTPRPKGEREIEPSGGRGPSQLWGRGGPSSHCGGPSRGDSPPAPPSKWTWALQLWRRPVGSPLPFPPTSPGGAQAHEAGVRPRQPPQTDTPQSRAPSRFRSRIPRLSARSAGPVLWSGGPAPDLGVWGRAPRPLRRRRLGS